LKFFPQKIGKFFFKNNQELSQKKIGNFLFRNRPKISSYMYEEDKEEWEQEDKEVKRKKK
jgi:hypothetical protein